VAPGESPYPASQVFRCDSTETVRTGRQSKARREASNRMSILWIILIVILVLALLGFFSRGRW
jgi:flagellar basal body-associated protein FliL